MNLKKILFIFSFSLMIILLTGCNFFASNEDIKCINTTFGFELPEAKNRVERIALTWHEKNVFEVWDLTTSDPTEKLKNLEQWHSFPIPEEDYKEICVKYKTFYMNDKHGNIYEFPKINDGYYLYSEDMTEVYTYIFAMFDISDKKLYFYYYKDSYKGFVYDIDSTSVFGFEFPALYRREKNAIDETFNKNFEVWDFYFKKNSVNFDNLSQWHKLPLPNEYQDSVYGIEEKPPKFMVHDKQNKENYTFPYIKDGYYLYNEEKTDYYDILFAMFDNDNKILYLYYSQESSDE